MNQMEPEKLPLDARLLSEAIIEFNISRRSVSLYPPGHEVIRKSIERTYELLLRLFELRSKITLGIARDVLVIDEYVLDRNNPVYRECALSFHERGIASITFSSSLTMEELVALHEVLTRRDGPNGAELVEAVRQRGVRGLVLVAIDLSNFGFVEDETRPEDESQDRVWEDYIYGLLGGRLSGEEAAGVIETTPVEKVAALLNRDMPEKVPDETYDRVITTYLRGRAATRMTPDSVHRLFDLIENLNPDLKRQFLSRTFSNLAVSTADMEAVLREMESESFQKIFDLFSRHAAMIPDTLKNVIDKLGAIRSDGGKAEPEDFEEGVFHFDVVGSDAPVLHDIEIADDIAGLFEEDHFDSYVSERYRRDLDTLLRKSMPIMDRKLVELRDECSDHNVERVLSEVMIEVLESDVVSKKDYLDVLTALTDLATTFVSTGRFEETLEIYNTLYTHSLGGRFQYEAQSALQYYFQQDAFLTAFVESARTWGRKDREGVVRLGKALRTHIISPLIEVVREEQDAGARKYLLTLLAELGSDILPEAVHALQDERWYVRRNMLYLIRHCGNAQYVDEVRKHAKDKDPRICAEAVHTLLHFKTSDAEPFLRVHLQSDNDDLRMHAIKLAGMYKVREATPVLAELLERKDLFGTAAHTKIPIVKALAMIGDPRALPAFAKILHSKALIYRGGLEELKLEIYRSLAKFPFEEAKDLIRTGVNSKNEKIRSICQDLMLEAYSREKVDPNA